MVAEPTAANGAAVAERPNAPPAPGRPCLSPSRAADFLRCPLLYRFRVIDGLPERPSRAAVRGTVVHGVLERLFDLPAPDRSADRAASMLEPEWSRLLAEEPEVAELFAEDGAGTDLAGWLAECAELLERYFQLEDPRRLEPAEREVHVEAELSSGLMLHGYIDRVDVAAGGQVRIVDYKTGRAPGEGFEAKALFQLRCYALAMWRTRGVLPAMLQLIYLGSGERIGYVPEERDLLATERKLAALWRAIDRATATGDFRPSPGPLCSWCDHQACCPAWGGEPPAYPTATRSLVPPPAQPAT